MLAILAPDEPPLTEGELRHRVLLRPAFHPAALISARAGATPSLRLAAQLRPWADGDPPVIHEAATMLSPAQAEGLWTTLAACVPGLDAPDDRRGLDGITAVFELAEGAAPPRRITAWSPEPGDARHTYLATLHALARAVLLDEIAQRTLEQLHGYLELGLPARDHGGTPRRLQIFGRLSSGEEGELAALFAAVPPEIAVVVDMANFEGMGTLLHPLFRRFSRRAGPTAWAVSRAARQHLEQAGVAAEQLFDELAAALRGLTSRWRE
jgi:hypothetical protein